MNDASNTEDTPKHGRRTTDNPEFEAYIPPTKSNRWGSILNGLGLAFILTVCVATGGFLRQVGTNVGDIDENKQTIKEILVQNNALLVTLSEQNAQQKASDKRFEGMFKDVIDGLDDVDDSVRDNEKDIIIMQQKMSSVDNTSVYLAMR
jgi:hypothetical protein